MDAPRRRREFMPKYDERNELAPRDVVAGDSCRDAQKQLTCAYLDITKKDADDIAKNFPGIYKELKKRNLDMTKQRIPVRPAAHYLWRCQDEHWRRDESLGFLRRRSGLHGCTRCQPSASNSLLEGVVFARRAVKTATKKSKKV